MFFLGFAMGVIVTMIGVALLARALRGSIAPPRW